MNLISKVQKINLTLSINHGKGYSRASLFIINRWQDNNNLWVENEETFPLTNARCCKDGSDILHNTFAPLLNAKLKTITEATYIYKDEDIKVSVRLKKDTTCELLHKISSDKWMCGDFLYYSIALGQEGAAPHWCSYCDLSKSHWSNKQFHK